MSELLDSFVFDVSLFDKPITDYTPEAQTPEFTNEKMVQYCRHSLFIYNIIKDTYIHNKYEIKGVLFLYVSNNLQIPRSNTFHERLLTSRILKFVDKTINIFLEMQRTRTTNEDRRREYIIILANEMFKNEISFTII